MSMRGAVDSYYGPKRTGLRGDHFAISSSFRQPLAREPRLEGRQIRMEPPKRGGVGRIAVLGEVRLNPHAVCANAR